LNAAGLLFQTVHSPVRLKALQRQQLKRLENCPHRDDGWLTMKSQLIAIVAAVLLVGCGESQQSAPAPEAKPVEPIAEVPAQPSPPPAVVEPPEPIAEAAKPTTPPKAVSANKGADPARGINPEPPTAKAPEISIHDAARTGSIEAVKQHLADGADVNAKSRAGTTPLHLATWGHTKIIELLIANGADVNAKNVGGGTPLDWIINQHPKTADLLRKHGGKAGEELKAKGN
jgi:hypothetical protein